MTSEAIRDPHKDALLTPQNCILTGVHPFDGTSMNASADILFTVAGH